eukprot:155315_1
MRRPSLFKCSWQRECGSVDSIFFVFYDKLPHIIAIYSVFTNKQLSYPSSAKYMLIAFVHSRHLYYAFIWPNNDLNKSSSNESLFIHLSFVIDAQFRALMKHIRQIVHHDAPNTSV